MSCSNALVSEITPGIGAQESQLTGRLLARGDWARAWGRGDVRIVAFLINSSAQTGGHPGHLRFGGENLGDIARLHLPHHTLSAPFTTS